MRIITSCGPCRITMEAAMKYGLLDEDDVFQSGDEMWREMAHEWEPIPEQWAGMSAKHTPDTTYGRFNIQIQTES